MDGPAFDTLIARAGAAGTRRAALRLVLAAAFTAGLGRIVATGADEAAAKKKPKPKPKPKRCSRLGKVCGGDSKRKCCKAFVCREDRCACPKGTVKQGTTCVKAPPVPEPECVDDGDCGANEICQNGSCVPEPPQPECVDDGDCGNNEACQGGTCVCPELEDGRCIRRCESGADCPGFPSCRDLSPGGSPGLDNGVCVDEPFLLCEAAACTTNSQCQSDEVCVITTCDGSAGRCFPFSVF